VNVFRSIFIDLSFSVEFFWKSESSGTNRYGFQPVTNQVYSA